MTDWLVPKKAKTSGHSDNSPNPAPASAPQPVREDCVKGEQYSEEYARWNKVELPRRCH
ncbi:hypothetical protein DIPPA_07906 [Diplonema papillatum]|nr:hypothetical protein DIPPA_07906 [Diplonema papillatum]